MCTCSLAEVQPADVHQSFKLTRHRVAHHLEAGSSPSSAKRFPVAIPLQGGGRSGVSAVQGVALSRAAGWGGGGGAAGRGPPAGRDPGRAGAPGRRAVAATGALSSVCQRMHCTQYSDGLKAHARRRVYLHPGDLPIVVQSLLAVQQWLYIRDGAVIWTGSALCRRRPPASDAAAAVAVAGRGTGGNRAPCDWHDQA